MMAMLRKMPFMMLTVLILSTTLSACTLATFRPIDEDITAKEGFNVANYVSGIWDSEFLPTLEQEAVEVNQLLDELDANQNGATERYGKRTSNGPFSFMVQGEAQVLLINRDSRVGLAEMDLAPYDGTADIYMAIGPVLRGNALRDAVGFIAFNDFTNQVEFAQVSDALKDRVTSDVLGQTEVDELVGKTIRFLGAFTLADRNEIVVMPVRLEVVE